MGRSRRYGDGFQLGKNCFLARGSKNPDAHLAVAEVQKGRKTTNAVPQSEVGIPIELHAHDFQAIRTSTSKFASLISIVGSMFIGLVDLSVIASIARER